MLIPGRQPRQRWSMTSHLLLLLKLMAGIVACGTGRPLSVDLFGDDKTQHKG